MNRQEFLEMSLPEQEMSYHKIKCIDPLPNEVFKKYPLDQNYEVSNFGRIKSLDRVVKHNYGGLAVKKSKILAQIENHNGYLSVGITSNGITRTTRVSRIVAITWIPNPENKPQVNHKRGIKCINTVEELEWSTIGENIKHSNSTGLAKKQSDFLYIQNKMNNINAYLAHNTYCKTPIDIGRIIIDQNCYRIEYENGKIQNLIMAVREFGVEFNLLLRNLPDLTKPIEHKGEKFVPIVELLKPEIDIAGCKIEWIGSTIVADGTPILSIDNLNLPINKWLKLISWHFNLMDENEPFVDVNTLPENPYK